MFGYSHVQFEISSDNSNNDLVFERNFLDNIFYNQNTGWKAIKIN